MEKTAVEINLKKFIKTEIKIYVLYFYAELEMNNF